MPAGENLRSKFVGGEESSFKREGVQGDIEQEKDLLTWMAPGRPFKRRNREFYVTIIAIAAIVGLVIFIAEGWVPVILLISLIFLFYIMSTVEPDPVEYAITNRGIKVAGKRTDWEIMGRFWFSKRFDSELLIIETAILPGRLELVINEEVKEKITENLSKYLLHEEAPPSWLDRLANTLSKRLPGNNL